MQPLQLMITQQGYAALFPPGGGGTGAVRISQLGLTASGFIMAPTIDALPGEHKRIDTVGGTAVAPNIIHLTATDASEEVYDVRGLGLYLDDGTLFAVFAQATPIFRKVAATSLLFVQDVIFAQDIADLISFGPVSFLNPPATETVKGVAEIATIEEATAGADDLRIITPRKLKLVLDILSAAISTAIADGDAALSSDMDNLSAALTNALNTLAARSVTGGGLVTGGGALTADRILTVLAASAADVAAGTADDRAITPAALSGLAKSIAQNGHAFIPGLGGLRLMWGRFTSVANGSTAVLFPDSFANACFVVLTDGVKGSGNDSQDNPAGVDYPTITRSGFSVFSADDSANACGYFALGA